MEDQYIVQMDDDQIRFTPDGRVYVLDQERNVVRIFVKK